ncbi:MAG: hypothetical protein JWR03_2668 [Cohnella sp.]|nr:hypothetical protein [Cohnella sp.]
MTRDFRINIVRGAALLMFGMLLAGCRATDVGATVLTPDSAYPTEAVASGSTQARSNTSSEPVGSLQARIAIRSPMTLSNNLLPGTAGKNVYLRIQLYEGTYSEDWNPGAYMGTLYEGRYQIVIADQYGKTLSTTKLDNLFPEPLVFTNHFTLAFEDYNGDGFPDFTLGQRANSNGGEYKILTIAEDLTVRELPVRGEHSLYVSKGGEGGSNYSVKLNKSKTGLLSYSYYSQDKGKYIDRTLKWQSGEFVPVAG